MQCPWDKCRQLMPSAPLSHWPPTSSCHTLSNPELPELVVWLLFYPTLMMSVCRAKPQIATWLPARANLSLCLLPLPLPLLFPAVDVVAVVALNKSKEIAFNVYLQQIKIKSIACRRTDNSQSPFSQGMGRTNFPSLSLSVSLL